MEMDITLSLLIRQQDFLGAATYVAENTRDEEIRARRLREVIVAAREVHLVTPYAQMDELLDAFGAVAGLTPPPIEVNDLDIIHQEAIGRECFDEDEITNVWDEAPTNPGLPSHKT